MITAKDELDKYATLNHYRDAANHRTSFKQSLRKFSDIHMKRNDNDADTNENDGKATSMPTPSGAFLPSPEPVTELEDMEEMEEPEPKEMPHATTTMNDSPVGRGRSIENATESYKERCDNCPGIWIAKMLEEDVPQDAGSDDDDSTVELKTARHSCQICRGDTAYFCQGCRRWLCMGVPKKRKVKLKASKGGDGAKKARRKQSKRSKDKTVTIKRRIYSRIKQK